MTHEKGTPGTNCSGFSLTDTLIGLPYRSSSLLL
ncbi:hypothetical protein Thiosp_01647 [Thiorhodovibrio litoralis]|nr:hypothetical protein Thiosp_01647 [Thiorhodovibrio litoralis]